MSQDRITNEQQFHDQWAKTANIADIDVIGCFEALTSPELRKIFYEISKHPGKKILDVGCGLGEASVYFAVKGYDVTAIDLSREMLNATAQLAKQYSVSVRTHQASAEALNFKAGEAFDVIYVGNLLHHVDIQKTIHLLLPHLKPDGLFVSWDPIEYNPIINVYRWLASSVRTKDEHPLIKRDIDFICQNFQETQVSFYWLTALFVFIWMLFVQRKNPNKIRFWKEVVKDSKNLAWLYRPLSQLDSFLLRHISVLRWLTWNVVIVGRRPKLEGMSPNV